MVKKSLLWVYRAILSALWLTIIVLALSILALRYFILPNIENYKDRIAQDISRVAGQKITIGEIHASWNGMNPHLSLRQVAIYDTQDRLSLTLHEIETSLSWLSIPLLEPKLSSLLIQGPALSVRREADGTLLIAGMEMGGDGSTNPELANWVLRQSRIDIVNATVLWQDDMRQAPALTLNNVRLAIENPVWERLLDRHRFALQATPSAGSSHTIDLRGNLHGADVANLNSWHGTIYGRLDGTDISAWWHWVDMPIELSEGYGAARFWLEFGNGAANRLTSDVSLQQVRARVSKDTEEILLDTLSGRLIWTNHIDGESLQLAQIKLTTGNGLNLEGGNISIRERNINHQEIIEGTVKLDEIDLASINTFSGILPLPQDSAQRLAAIAPVGQLSQLEVSWKGTRKELSTYNARMHFQGLGIQAYGELPGFSGLGGTLVANEKQGNLSIDAHQATLDLKNVMRWPIPMEQLTGTVRWQQLDQGIDVRVNNLTVSSVHLAGSVNATYHHRTATPSSIELSGHFDRADARHALFYYPRILGKDTLHWLDHSIISGNVTNANVIIRGRVDQFPYVDPQQGLFKVTARLEDGVLDYADDWPSIEHLNLNLLFQGAKMELTADSGQILGNQIMSATAVIPVLDADDPILEVHGESEGSVMDGLRFVDSSPVLELVDGFTDNLQANGTGRLKLSLHIPLEDVDETRVKGSYQLIDVNMSSPAIPALSNINGQLEFTESSLTARSLATYIYGGPARLDISSGDNRLVSVRARGNMPASGLQQALGYDVSNVISGYSSWFSDIRIQPQQIDITIRSNLVGMAVDLPAPLGKSAADSMPLRIEKRQLSALRDQLDINVNNQINASILLSSSNGESILERGEIGINQLPEMPLQPGISVRGGLEQLDLDAWLEALAKLKSTNTAATSNALPIQKLALSIGTLDIFERRLNALKLDASPTTDGWQMQIQSKEMNGTARWIEQGNGKVLARLQNLTVPAKAPTATDNTSDEQTTPKSIEYPDLDITAENFILGQKELGRLELTASERNNAWYINQLKISNPDSILTAEGEWHNWRRHPNTQMNVLWEINDAGSTLTRYGYPKLIKGGSARLEGKLRWPNSPHEFNIEQLSGNFSLDARSGQILKIQPGVGRLFSVLTLQNLPRRLTFDFRDVLSSGFAFDKVTSSATIDQGVMHSDDFLLQGPAAKIEIKGETDLKKETQHLRVKVTPFISDSLSLAALAGGPAVAAATFVAQKLLKDPLNKFAADEYEITGTWDEPIEVKHDKSADEPTQSIPGQP